MISSWSISLIALRSSPFAPTKLVPLSHLNSRTGPLCTMKWRSAFRKLSVSNEWPISAYQAGEKCSIPLVFFATFFYEVGTKVVSANIGEGRCWCESVLW